jgi:serine/threonine protein kinase
MSWDTSKPVLQAVGNYDLLEKIAEGGMGTIYKGRHRTSGQVVALKLMPAHLAANLVMLKRFEQEFRAASMLNHPNVVRALDFGDDGTTPYLVMEFVEGESLGQKIERDGKMPESEAIRLIAQVAQGLHRAHKQGMIHRDVKPDNVLVTPDGQAKLADLGLVKEIETDLNLTRTGRGLGTPHFMAPEQFRNAKNATVQCDIYSLGATLYMMVTGELPFGSTNGPLDAWMKKIHNELVPPRQLVPDVSERVDWAIRRAMSAAPDQRPATCREFVEDLTGHSTRRISTAEVTAAQDVWYLVYKDEEGEQHTVKGSTSAIRRSLREGLLGDASNVRGSRTRTGPFELLRGYPEFRDLVVSPAPMPGPPGRASGVTTTPVAGLPTPPTPPTPPRAATPVAMPYVKPPSKPAVPAAGGRPQVPLIDLGAPGTGEGQSLEWLKWLGALVVALGIALVTFYFLF